MLPELDVLFTTELVVIICLVVDIEDIVVDVEDKIVDVEETNVERYVLFTTELVVIISGVVNVDETVGKDVMDSTCLVLDFEEHTMDTDPGCITALS